MNAESFGLRYVRREENYKASGTPPPLQSPQPHKVAEAGWVEFYCPNKTLTLGTSKVEPFGKLSSLLEKNCTQIVGNDAMMDSLKRSPVVILRAESIDFDPLSQS